MKKRRELNALVGNVKSKRNNSAIKKDRSKVNRELLRNETDSSDEYNEYTIQHKSTLNKITESSFTCASCLTAFGFFLLMTCLVSCAALVWVHLELKREFDEVKSHVALVEKQNEKSQAENARLSLNRTQAYQALLQSCKKGLDQSRTNHTAISTEIKSLKEKLGKPHTAESVATLHQELTKLGSDLKTKQAKDETIQSGNEKKFTELSSRIKVLESADDVQIRPNNGRDNQAIPQYVYSLRDDLHNTLEKMNKTLLLHCEKNSARVNSTILLVHQLDSSIVKIQTDLHDLSDRVTAIPTDSSINITNFKDQLITQLSPAITRLIKDKAKQETKSNMELSNLVEKVANITVMVQTLGTNITKIKTQLSSRGDNQSATQIDSLMQTVLTTQSQIQPLNKSIEILKQEIASLNSTFTQKILFYHNTIDSNQTVTSPLDTSTQPTPQLSISTSRSMNKPPE